MARGKVRFLLALFGLSLIHFPGAQAQTYPWPMFHRDGRNTGRSPYSASLAPGLKWSYLLGDGCEWVNPAVGRGDVVYAGCNDGNLYAFSSEGTMAWSFLTGGRVVQTAALGARGELHIGSLDRNFYKINSDGTLLWSYDCGRELWSSSPTIGGSGRVYTATGTLPSVEMTGLVYAFDSSGGVAWSYRTGAGGVESAPALDGSERIFIGSNDKNLYALNSDGTLFWSYAAATGVSDHGIEGAPAMREDGSLYVGVAAVVPNYYCINSDGSFSWSYGVGAAARSSPALGPDGQLYGGSDDYNVYAINSDGSLGWSYRTGHRVMSSATISADGHVYIMSNDDYLYCIDSAGGFAWSYRTDYYNDLLWYGPAVGSDGTLYTGSRENRMFAIFAHTPTPSQTATFTQTATNTAAPTQTPTSTPTLAPPSTHTPTATQTSTGTPTSTTTPMPAVRINFQPFAAETPPGYLRDYGQDYGLQGGYEYGWL